MSAYDRIPPASLTAERAVIGSCLLDKEALSDITEILVPDDFYDVNHIETYQAIYEMNQARKPIDLISVSGDLVRRGIFEKLGGQSFLAGLVDEVPTTANAVYHANIIKGHSIQRKLIEAGNHIVRLGYSTGMEAAEALDEAERAVFEVAQKRNSSSIKSIFEILRGGTFDKVEQQYRSKGADFEGFNSGFLDLDDVTRGFQKGSLNIIAARPSMGKTALALNIAQFGGIKTQKGGGVQKAPVLVFSLEMSADQLVMRMLSSGARVNSHKIHTGMLSTGEWNQLVKAAGELETLPIYIDDSSVLATMDLRTRCRRFKSKHEDLGLIVVDYLQLMSHPGGRGDNKQQEVAEISRALKAVARETECPVIALSQLSRGVESRTEKKPMLSDLRDSGAIEQDADVVMMLYRPDYYDGDKNTENNSEASLNIAKNRNGPTREIKLFFDREYTLFTNAALGPGGV